MCRKIRYLCWYFIMAWSWNVIFLFDNSRPWTESEFRPFDTLFRNSVFTWSWNLILLFFIVFSWYCKSWHWFNNFMNMLLISSWSWYIHFLQILSFYSHCKLCPFKRFRKIILSWPRHLRNIIRSKTLSIACSKTKCCTLSFSKRIFNIINWWIWNI